MSDRRVSNSIADYIDAGYLLSEIQLLRDDHQGTFLLVEGPSDEVFYERFVDKVHCKIVISNGKANALEALTLLSTVKGASAEGCLAIVDSDFDVLAGQVPPANVHLTDGHDLETMLFASPAFDKLLAEFCQRSKHQTFVETHGDLRARLLDSATPVGHLLWLSLREDLGLRFKGLNFGDFIHDRTLDINRLQMIQTVLNHSHKTTPSASELAQRLDKEVDELHDPLHVCSGHHLIHILAIGLRKALGTHNAGQMPAEHVEKILRTAYEEAFFFRTRLYRSLAQWQAAHAPFVVLKEAEPVLP